MVRNIVLSDINNEITRIYNSIGSFIVILVVIKNIKASIGAVPIISESPYPYKLAPAYLATSAYVSIAFIFFLFFSASGMMTLRTPSRSPTFANESFKSVLRYPRRWFGYAP